MPDLSSQIQPPDENLLGDLLSLWQQHHQTGRDVPAEVLCRDRPELVAELQRRIEAVRRMSRLAQPETTTLSLGPADFPLDGTVTTTLSRPDGTTRAPATPQGITISGYEVLEVLGRGGMGVVYKARQAKLNRLVALKMILAGAHAGPEDLARFRAEAEAVASLHHPNIVQVYQAGDESGCPYYSLEYVDGGTLADRLTGKPWPAREAAELLETLTQAVHAAHERGVIHRDLKPANVLLTADGTPKITDFGLAKRLSTGAGLTRTGAVLGTPAYMPPEQAQGKGHATGPPADVYALGAILYELLTGQPPFLAETPLDTLMAVVSREIVPPCVLQPGVPRDLEAVCLKCLQKAPERRYPSAEELAEDLRRFLAGRRVDAPATGSAERVIAPMKRRGMRRLLFAGLGAAACLVLALILFLHAGSQQRALQEKGPDVPELGPPDIKVGEEAGAEGAVPEAAHRDEDEQMTVPIGQPPRLCERLPSFDKKELNKVHALLVCDTNSSFGKEAEQDQKNMETMLLRNMPPDRCDVRLLSGRGVTRENILAYYKQLKVGPSDAVLFYYVGLGVLDHEKGHYFFFHMGGGGALLRSTLRKAMRGTRAGLVVILTDCSAEEIMRGAIGGPSVHGKDPVKVAPTIRQAPPGGTLHPLLRSLLLQHRGVVDINGTDEGSIAYGDTHGGGLFTSTLVKLMSGKDRHMDEAGAATWKELFPHIRREMEIAFRRMVEEARGRGASIETPSQSPRRFAENGFGVVEKVEKADDLIISR